MGKAARIPTAVPPAKYPHFTELARQDAYALWLRERGPVDWSRFVVALEGCYRHDVYGTTDASALFTLEWALAITSWRSCMNPAWIAADWAHYRRIVQLDPWQRVTYLPRQRSA